MLNLLSNYFHCKWVCPKYICLYFRSFTSLGPSYVPVSPDAEQVESQVGQPVGLDVADHRAAPLRDDVLPRLRGRALRQGAHRDLRKTQVEDGKTLLVPSSSSFLLL